MPSSATITSTDLTTFVTRTTISSSQMNNNFGVFRGHNLPVDPNTSSAADATYDLGSTEYHWSNAWVKNVKLQGQTNSAHLTLSVQTMTADLNFKLPGTAGSASQALLTDGSGNMSWGSPAAAVDISGSTQASLPPAADDKLLIYDTSASANVKIALDEMFRVVNGFTAETAVDMAADYLPIYDAGGGTIKKISPDNVIGGLRPSFYATKSDTQSISHDTVTKVQFNSESIDSNSNYDPSTNYRFTPTVAGVYLIGATLYFANGVDTTHFYAALYKNGSLYTQNMTTAANSDFHFVTVVALISMNGSTDYVECYTYQNSGSARNVGGSGTNNYFWGMRFA